MNPKPYVGGKQLPAVFPVECPVRRSIFPLPLYFHQRFRGGVPILSVALDGVLLLRIYALYNRNKRGMFHQFGGCASAHLI